MLNFSLSLVLSPISDEAENYLDLDNKCIVSNVPSRGFSVHSFGLSPLSGDEGIIGYFCDYFIMLDLQETFDLIQSQEIFWEIMDGQFPTTSNTLLCDFDLSACFYENDLESLSFEEKYKNSVEYSELNFSEYV